MENTKDLFVKAFMEAERLDSTELPSEDEIQWDFSEKFEKSMQKLIQKNNRINLSVRRNIRKGLLAAIFAILVLFTGLMSVSATRKPIIEFVKKVFPQFNEITLSNESIPPVDAIETEYTLSYLPDGFNLDTYQKDDCGVFSVWKNSSGEEIAFSQSLLDSNFSIDNEHYYKEFEINGQKAFYAEDEHGAVLIYTDGYYWFTISVPADNIKDIIMLQEKISEKN